MNDYFPRELETQGVRNWENLLGKGHITEESSYTALTVYPNNSSMSLTTMNLMNPANHPLNRDDEDDEDDDYVCSQFGELIFMVVK